MGRPKSPIPFAERNSINQRNYRLRHPEKRKETKEKWRKANMESYRRYNLEARLRNPEKFKERERKYAQDNPDKIYLKTKKRRARLKNSIHIPYSRSDIYDKHEGICHLCNEIIKLTFPAKHPMSLSLDHIIPLSLGGVDAEENLAPAHYGCNSRKGNRI